MKKTIIIAVLILALGIGSAIAYADSGSTMPFGRNFGRMPWSDSNLTEKEVDELIKERQKFHEENMEYRKEDLKKALENGEMTQKQYDSWLEHFTYMDEFHQENAFRPGCSGRGMGRAGRGMGMMSGFGNNKGGFY